jgi:hypothetical protein
VSIIESLTREAAHRRDHGLHVDDSVSDCSNCFEIIFIGCSCFCVCHDCGFDTPMVSESFAYEVKSSHCCPQC